ncbi:hypothetical protein MAPG_06524 [Magnaporthiopsis poae ATCC 64411]|uniref:ATP-dependent DNA helicase II subunit 2 n=1 Tax=Magnaporthiopsis poae (strain ATCC 64411 / 73-15) TaxID=644358 RepID=A0A0C4E294_MAGP6|nr:hypothetical protein MAPG_06524 [Magnaporthiopsis poae ATCC 64411]
MADKEVTVFIVDLGQTMGNCNGGRVESDLDWSMRYIWDKLCTIVAASRKTWQVGVLGLRTDDTNNVHHEGNEDGYENISVLQPVGPMTMTSLKELRDKISPSSTQTGDAISAIVVAINLIDNAAPQRLKYKRKIVLVTDGLGPIDEDSLDDIWARINELNIELTVVGVDFDDPEYPFKEEDKPRAKAKNEKLLRTLTGNCKDAVFGTMAEAVKELENPRIKPTRPYKTFDGHLTLGDPKVYGDSALSIRVERYFKTKAAHAVSASTVVAKTEPGAEETQSTRTARADEDDSIPADDKLTGLHTARNYRIKDESAPGGKRDVAFESLAKGYEYGRTAIHISESEHNITKLETTKEFTIIGFIPKERYEPFLNMGEACVTLAAKFSEKDEIALSALINALYDTESYAVARLVTKDGKDPQIVLLMPESDVDFECLYDVPLPFAEDLRHYQFPPLDKIVTLSGQTLTKHRLLPSDELEQAMSDYVDAMDLSSYYVGEDGEPSEYAPIDETFSPMIHRVNQAIRQRVVHPDKPLEPATGVLTPYSVPPEKLVAKAADQIKELVRIADVKKVPPKVKGKRRREPVKPISGLDVDALLDKEGPKKRAKISVENSVPEFKQLLASADEVSIIEDATRQMGVIIRNLIHDSMGDSNYDRATENLRVMRDELVALEEPELYNGYLRSLKKSIAAGELSGDRREMWWHIKLGKLGLVSKKESDVSNVTEEEALEFLRTSV